MPMFNSIKLRLFVPLCSILLLLFCPRATHACDGSIAKMWSKGDVVREIQYYLQKLEYLEGSVDGIYGNKTAGAVKRFQQDNSLEATGLVGQVTFDLLHFSSDEFVAKRGSRGRTVREIQDYLYKLGYIREKPDGVYGKITFEAVKAFQLEHGLEATGKVNRDTYEILKESYENINNYIDYIVKPEETLFDIAENFNSSVAAIMVRNNLPDHAIQEGQVLQIPVGVRYRRSVTSRGRSASVQAIPWSIMDQLWKPGETAMITDVKTGESFAVKRLGGRYHSDVEPLTAKDAKTMHKILNNRWSWERRSIVVTLRSLKIAASMNGMPHGVQRISGNGFNGHFCVHFLGSRVHVSYSVDADHLSKIEEAENTFKIDDSEILSSIR